MSSTGGRSAAHSRGRAAERGQVPSREPAPPQGSLRSRPQPRPGRTGVWLRAAAGPAVLLAVVWWFPAEVFTSAFVALEPSVLAWALGVGAVTTVASAARWVVVARSVGLRLSWGRAVSDYYVAVLLNAVLPAGVLGNVHRAVGHGRYCGDLGRGVRAVVLERVAGQMVLAGSTVLVLFTLPTALLGPSMGAVAVSAGTVTAVLAVGAVGLRLGRERRPRWWRALRTSAHEARAGLLERAPSVVVFSVAALAGHVFLFLVASSAAGVEAPASQVVPLAVLALLAMSVPVNVGGWGPREAAAAAAFGAAGLGAQAGVTVSVVYGLLALVAAVPGSAVLGVRVLTAHLPRSAGRAVQVGQGHPNVELP